MIEKIFEEYVSNYDLTNEDIKLKYNHSYRVMKLAIKYAKKLNYSKEDIQIAKIIGLFHDIGRFEQLQVYKTYNNSKSIDHADHGAYILFQEKLIDKLKINKEWYQIIEFSIRNHDKKEIESCTDERTLMHAKLIRDIDKLDILYLLGNIYVDMIDSDDSEISPKVLESINNHQEVNLNDRVTKNDIVASKLAFSYDINNNNVIPELLKNYRTYYKKINKKIFKKIYQEITNYLKGRVDNHDRNGN